MTERQINRVYPIRKTRNKWKIPLFCYHKCSEECDTLIIENSYSSESENENYIIINNPDYKDGKCSYSDKIKKTYIRLSVFDINNPLGHKGPLYNSDQKVIFDNSFIVFIYYPLSHVLEVTITTPSSDGFTLKELLYSISTLYKFVYSEEERTAIPQIYPLKKVCSSCGNKNLSEYIEENIDKACLEEDCCICCSKYEDLTDELDIELKEKNKTVKLKCNHIFHNDCIRKWLNKSCTCPICRSNIFECKNCDGSGIIYYNFTGIVIPPELRGNILNRNETFGIFGIHSYDLEDLIIENMYYDKIKKQLTINITV